MSDGKGTFFVITGPSAAGKSSVVDTLGRRYAGQSCRLVTTTTRPRRPGEQNGREYHFLSRLDFEARREAGEFLEWAETYTNLYGSSRVELDKLLAGHAVVFAIIDVKGAKEIKRLMPECVTVFLSPGTPAELRARLASRPGAKPADIERRFKDAEEEMLHSDAFDHCIVNHHGQLAATLDAFVALMAPHFERWKQREKAGAGR